MSPLTVVMRTTPGPFPPARASGADVLARGAPVGIPRVGLRVRQLPLAGDPGPWVGPGVGGLQLEAAGKAAGELDDRVSIPGVELDR